jgi:serine/threonine-protein kinase
MAPAMQRRVAARYVLHEEVGVGGTARVYRGRDEQLDRPVAVKVLDARLAATSDPAGRDRFLRECRTAAGIDHPAAVTVYDAGEDGEDLYLVMELVEGESLAHRLARGPLPLAEALHVAQTVLAVLQFAHGRGIVHRDVKPANVLMGSKGHIKLSDFGIAKRFDDLEASVTSTGLVMGTPRYLAPEQSAGLDVTPATDIYAVGVLLYEMLAGRPPFAGETAIAIALAQRTAPVPDVRTERPDVPAAVAAAISAAMSADPAERPATAEEFAAALTVRPDVTAEMPAIGGPRVMPVATAPTTAMTAAGGGLATVPSANLAASAPRPPSDEAVDDRAPAIRRRPSPLLVLGVLVTLLAIGGLAMALGDRDGSAGPADGDGASTAAAAEIGPWGPDTTVSSEPVPEIVPGFSRTDDLLVFLAQLETTPEVVGDGGEELGRRLREALVEEDDRRRAERVGELRRWLPGFVDDGHVHPAVAAALDELLAPLDTADDDGDDDDGDDGRDGDKDREKDNGRGDGRGRGDD